MEDNYFFLGSILKKDGEKYTLLLHDGTVINNLNLNMIYEQIVCIDIQEIMHG